MLDKQSVPINFSQGLDTKTDPYQVSAGRFLSLQNSIFTKGGLLQKRNGFGQLPSLPDATNVFATTFNGNLLAIGEAVEAFSVGSSTWVSKGKYAPLELSTLPLVRSNTNQSQSDTAFAANGLVCTVFTDNPPSGPVYKYVIADSITGQNIVNPTPIPVSSGAVTGSPRVFLLGRHFLIVITNTISGTPHLQYVAISTINPIQVSGNVDISANYSPASSVAFDGAVVNNSLYLAWNSGGSAGVRMTYLDSTLVQHNTVLFAGHSGNLFSVSGDTSGSTPVIYASFYDSISANGYTLAVTAQLVTIFVPVESIAGKAVLNLTSAAQNGVNTLFYEIIMDMPYDGSIPDDFVRTVTVSRAGTVGTDSVLLRGVGLASKAFIVEGTIYTLLIYSSPFQPTYFLVDAAGNVISKLAYSNGANGYYMLGLPSVTVSGQEARLSYFYKDLIQAVNKTQGIANTAGIYSQTGINLVNFTIGTSNIVTGEIGGDLNLSGGFMWMYDGLTPVEQGFHLWPDFVEVAASGGLGAMSSQEYFYVATYEWSDNQGNIFRSAPSIPVSFTISSTTPVTFTSVFTSGVSSIVVSSATGLFVGQILTDTTTGGNIQANTAITSITGTTVGLSLPTAGASASSPGDTLSTVTTGAAVINVPTLRLTYKTANPVKIVIYRWSAAQEVYYQVTSLAVPLLNDPTIDYVTYTDTQSDSSILGNNILYTTGGVLEDIAAPATNLITLFQSRLFLVDAEDPNLLWFSKQVIEATPVEMSDLLTIYVAPTIGAQGSTGKITALSAMDDKLVIFKNNAIYYINGQGPDNTGANSQFSDPTFITATVGCEVQNSIVFMPSGLMFQSDKGIWLLGRDLSTSYIGAPVESLTQGATVLSALNIPATNQVRFTLSSGVTLMYDYYYGQWGTFVNVPAISSTLYKSLHTYINSLGQVYQETPSLYLDGSSPVLMSFTTSWLNLSGIQGFQRAYFFYLLGTYMSPHKLELQISYDYVSTPIQTTIISPDNYSVPWGDDTLWGSTPNWGGEVQLEQWRVFLRQQKCRTFQLTLNELFDPQFGTTAGAGLTISGINFVIGAKKGFPVLRPSRSVG